MKKNSLSAAILVITMISMTAVSLSVPKCEGSSGEKDLFVVAAQEQFPNKIPEKQQNDWNAYQEKTMQLRKEYLASLVQSGILTQEQVEERIKLIEAIFAFRTKNSFIEPGAISGVKFTDEQRTEMRNLFEQRITLRKEALAAFVIAEKITQAQADSQLERMQYRFNYFLENGFSSQKGGHGIGIKPSGLDGDLWF